MLNDDAHNFVDLSNLDHRDNFFIFQGTYTFSDSGYVSLRNWNFV